MKYKQNIATLHIHTSKIQQPKQNEHLQNTQYYNQNKNCTSLHLKNGHGADKTS